MSLLKNKTSKISKIPKLISSDLIKNSSSSEVEDEVKSSKNYITF